MLPLTIIIDTFFSTEKLVNKTNTTLLRKKRTEPSIAPAVYNGIEEV